MAGPAESYGFFHGVYYGLISMKRGYMYIYIYRESMKRGYMYIYIEREREYTYIYIILPNICPPGQRPRKTWPFNFAEKDLLLLDEDLLLLGPFGSKVKMMAMDVQQ